MALRRVLLRQESKRRRGAFVVISHRNIRENKAHFLVIHRVHIPKYRYDARYSVRRASIKKLWTPLKHGTMMIHIIDVQ